MQISTRVLLEAPTAMLECKCVIIVIKIVISNFLGALYIRFYYTMHHDKNDIRLSGAQPVVDGVKRRTHGTYTLRAYCFHWMRGRCPRSDLTVNYLV